MQKIKWNRAPFVRYVIPFIIGIVLSVYISIPYFFLAIISVIGILFLLFTTLFSKFKLAYKKRWLNGIVAFIVLVCLGGQITSLNTEINFNNHFSKYLNKQTITYCEVIEPAIERENSVKIIVKVKAVLKNNEFIQSIGKAVLYFQKSPLSLHLSYGDNIIFRGNYNEIKPPQNPSEFDYQRYLSFHNIYHQAYIKPDQWKPINKNARFSIINISQQIRNYLLDILKKNKIKGDEFAVGSALLLGYEDKLDQGIINAYSATGALHVLSVSGLHVGIIYLVFSWMLSFLDKTQKGKIIKAILLLLFLWFYAMLTGLSPSVLRSAAMFSFIVIGQSLNKKVSIYNTLAVSAFFLLLFNPFLIMEVGFQLSYLAVIGIVFLQPKIYNLLYVKNKIIDAVWKISAVSIAAQIATFPLGLHYFHQFPNYFLFSNLIVIPVSTIIIYLGIGLIFLSKITFVADYLAFLFNFFIWFLNESVKWMEQLPLAILSKISISIFETWLLYFCIIFLVIYFINKKVILLKFSLILFLILLLYQVVEQYNHLHQKKIVVYNVSKHSAIDFIYGRENFLLSDSLLMNDERKMLFHINHNWWNLDINKTLISHSLIDNNFIKAQGNIILFDNKKIALLNKNNSAVNIKVDYVIISNDIDFSVKEIINKSRPQKIIFDSSNSFYKIKKWELDCKELKQDCYSVADSGAFILDI